MEANTTLNVDRDLAFIREMADDIKDYLLGNELYEQLISRDYMLPLGTLGGLFLRMHRLRALPDQMTDEQRIAFKTAAGHINVELDRWAVQAMEKVQREITARLRNWHAFLMELEQHPERHTSEYPTQAEGRTILDLLVEYAGDQAPPETEADLRFADVKLRDNTQPGEFVWGDEMQPAFPRQRFWWLYVQPRSIARGS